jgi:uncharacterized membrane protein
MSPLIGAENTWLIWTVLLGGVALCISLEQNYRWAARMSGPVLALLAGMLLSNGKLVPLSAPAYDIVDDYLVPMAIPLLLLRANVFRIWRETGSLLLCFHIATLGTLLGAFVAAFLFRTAFDRVPEVTGIMTASYIGGGVNFVAVRNSYQVASELTNPLLVADNFIMAAIFAVLFFLGRSRFMLRHYVHPHTGAGEVDARALAAEYWKPKQIALIDIAKALAIAFALTAVSVKLAGVLKGQFDNRLAQSAFGNPFLLITLITVAFTTVGRRWTERVQGTEELGAYFLYLFFFVIGLRADLIAVLRNVPVLFAFCLVMAVVNLVFTLSVGRLLKLKLEELLLSVNATLGGPASAAAMAIAMGWPKLVLPGLLAGLWGYVIGSFLGILVAETLLLAFGG